MLKKIFSDCKKCNCSSSKGGNPFYCIGFIGSLIYFWQTADPALGAKLLAIIKAIVWPGFFVYEVFKYIGG